MRAPRAVFGALVLAAGLWASSALAGSPGYLNIQVSVAASLSVTVEGVSSSTQNVSWNTLTSNAKLVSPAPVSVQNNTGANQEKWALSTNGASINTLGIAGSTWTLDTTTATLPGTDQFSVQAVFGSSNTAAGGCPGGTSSDWDRTFAPALTTAPVTYTTTVFDDVNLTNNGTPDPDRTTGGNNGKMFAGSIRKLCWRIITPSATNTADTQNVQIIITAQ